jgi:hypothetical protein
MKRLFFKNRQSSFAADEKPLPSLAVCLIMDILGYASFAIPFVGEFLDLLWAPISAMIFMRMFGGRKGLIGGIFNFIEEILPGLDFIPTFTIMWFLQYMKSGRKVFTVRPASANRIQQF